MNARAGRYALLVLTLVAAFVFSLLHRAQGSMDYLDGRFTGYDPYVYFRQAERIVEEGRLPKRDMERWLPFGRDLTLLHNLYSYALAHSYRAARAVFPDLTLYEYSCYAPPVLFAVTVVLLMAVLWTLFGWESACLASLFLVNLPSVAFRTSLGFGDRDGFCLFLGVLTGSLYLWQINAHGRRHRIALAAACGLTAALGCFSWEGFGLFALCVLIPATVSAWRQQKSVLELTAYCVCWAVPLLLFSSAHRFWIVPSEPAHPIGLVGVFPALAALSLIFIRAAFGGRHSGLKAAAVLSALTLASLLALRAVRSGDALSLAVPFSSSRLMQTIGETYNMTLENWIFGFGVLPLIAAGGVICSWVGLWKRREKQSFPLKTVLPVILFGTSWLLLWGFLTQISRRYAVMLAPAVVGASAITLIRLGDALARRLSGKVLVSETARCLFTTLLPAAILFSPFLGGFSITGPAHARPTYAQPSALETEGMRWMSQNLDRSDGQPVIAADWLYGVHLNVLADAVTIADTDTWKHYWIHLAARYLFCAESETEALQFLKTRDADYWMIARDNIAGEGAKKIEFLASGLSRDRNVVFSRFVWDRGGSRSFELVFENEEVKLFRIHYPSDLTVPPELYEAWTAPNFPDPELRRVWMGG